MTTPNTIPSINERHNFRKIAHTDCAGSPLNSSSTRLSVSFPDRYFSRSRSDAIFVGFRSRVSPDIDVFLQSYNFKRYVNRSRFMKSKRTVTPLSKGIKCLVFLYESREGKIMYLVKAETRLLSYTD